MVKSRFRPGDIIQINNDIERICFSGCLAVIDEVFSWGVLAYIRGPGETFISAPRNYYLRLNNGEFVHLIHGFNRKKPHKDTEEEYGIVMDGGKQ